MDFQNFCAYCGADQNLSRCSRCRFAHYCSKDHQKSDWKKHRLECVDRSKQPSSQSSGGSQLQVKNYLPNNSSTVSVSSVNNGQKLKSPSLSNQNISFMPVDSDVSSRTVLSDDSSESGIISAGSEDLGTILEIIQSEMNDPSASNGPISVSYDVSNRLSRSSTNALDQYISIPNEHLDFHYSSNDGVLNQLNQTKNFLYEVCQNVIRDMNAFGLCVIDDFLGPEKGMLVLEEVMRLHQAGLFEDGQLVRNKASRETKTIRGDQIAWVDGKENHCENIGMLISMVDGIVTRANRIPNNGKMGDHTINGRTKAMVACYPGNGTHYVKHVDNPNRDGRCITAIYYLNVDWNTEHGGKLRIFPESRQDLTGIEIEPIFDRILFFWSNRRNPHEVQPAYKTRYAITLWYFDAAEREEASRRYERESMCCGITPSHSNPPILTNCS